MDISIKRTLKIGHRLCRFCAIQQRKKLWQHLCHSFLVGAGGFASRGLKNSPQDCFLPSADGRPVRILPAPAQKNPQPKLRVLFGGSWWIRTTEALSSRFTVCPHWPLGKAPIFICASALTALDYYSRIRWKKQALFQKYFCKRRNGKRTAAVASALQSEKNNATPKETV